MGTTAGAMIRAVWLAVALGIPASMALPAPVGSAETRRPSTAWLAAAPDALLLVEAGGGEAGTGVILDAGVAGPAGPGSLAGVPMRSPSGATAGAASALLRAGFPAAPTRAPPVLSD